MHIMRLMRWTPATPARELTMLHDEFDRFFDGLFPRSAANGDVAPLFAPPVDIHETADEFQVRMDLPGVKSEDVKVTLHHRTLTIRGERKEETREAKGQLWRQERIHGAFERRFELGPAVRADQVSAHFNNGVLDVRVPKGEDAKLREIQVQAS
jgi:HSP20 family protein